MWKYLRLWAIALELNFCWIYAAVLSLAGNVYISLRFSCWQYLFFSEVLFPVIVIFQQGSLRSCCSGRVNKRMTAWSCLQLIALSSPHLLKWLDWIMRPAWWYWFYNLRLTTTTRARRESDFWHACYVIRVNEVRFDVIRLTADGRSHRAIVGINKWWLVKWMMWPKLFAI